MMTNDVEVCTYIFNVCLLIKSSFELDINECLLNPCPKTMKCENTPGSYRCIEGCDEGYIWSIKHRQCRGKLIVDWIFELEEIFSIRY